MGAYTARGGRGSIPLTGASVLGITMFNKIVKYSLDKVGPGFCLAKWTNSTMHLGTGKNHSCHHPDAHVVPVQEVVVDSSALHNSEYKKKQRQTMLDGGRPSECQYCWNIEDNSSSYSDRVSMSASFDSLPYFNKIKDSITFDPTNLEISFSNVCNFACAYCSPEFSSKWLSEINTHGPYSNGYQGYFQKQILDKEDNPYIDAFWDYLPKIYDKLHVLRVTGGEPLLSRHTQRLIDFISQHPNKKLTLVINSNLGVDIKIIEDFIDKLKQIDGCVKQINIATSGESVGKRAEYVRDGLDYTQWLENCRYVLTANKKIVLYIMSAYNVFSITSYTEFLKDISGLRKQFKRRVTLTVSYVRGPNFLSVATAPREWKHYLDESHAYIKRHFSKLSASRFKHVMVYHETYSQDASELEQLRIFIAEYDKRRTKSFKETFPEYDFV